VGTREKEMEPVVVMFARMAEVRREVQAALAQIEKLMAKKKEA
jgi:hypothetical protein